MADAPKKTTGNTAKPAPDVGKGVTLTAQQALKASEKATGPAVNPAPAKSAPAKPAPKNPAVVAKAKEIAAKAPLNAPIANETADKPMAVQATDIKAPAVEARVAAVDAAAAPVVTTSDAVNNEPPEGTTTPQPLEIPTSQPEQPALQTPAEGTKTMNDVIENTKKYSEDAKVRFQSAFAGMNDKAKAGVEKSTKAFEGMADIAKGNVEALVESSKIAAKGVEAIGQDAAEYGRLSFEKASATMKSLAAVKSPAEFFQLQSEMLSGAFDAFTKESAKTSEALLKLAGAIAQPLSSRVSVVTEKVKSLAA